MKYQQTELNLAVKEHESTTISCVTPAQLAKLFEHTRELCQETFNIATIDAQNKVIGTHLIALGTSNQAVIDTKAIFRAAINDNAAAIGLSHNHPSGLTNPSAEDIKLTKSLIEAGKIMSIKILDHVIIGRDFLSLREAGFCQFC